MLIGIIANITKENVFSVVSSFIKELKKNNLEYLLTKTLMEDKDRLLKFLSNFPEIIFEGHDTLEVERKRFEQIGFNTIEDIGYSERERIILRCRK